jgi:tRNA pseudouridine55 synthase
MEGLLVLDKPEGLTSFDVVRKVRRLLGVSKLGHTGTLDPLATGVLVLCLGEACKLVPFLTELDKTYAVHIALGVETDSHDAQGKVVQTRPVPALTPAGLEAHLSAFRGSFLLLSPMHSAIEPMGK